MLDGAGGANAAAKTAPGSAYVNDIFVRSVGKWASEILTGNTGMRGVLAPFRGKQISCVGPWMAGGGNVAYAYVDGNGDPFTRMQVPSAGYDTGWVAGYYIYLPAWWGNAAINWTMFEMTYVQGDNSGAQTGSCTAFWPPT